MSNRFALLERPAPPAVAQFAATKYERLGQDLVSLALALKRLEGTVGDAGTLSTLRRVQHVAGEIVRSIFDAPAAGATIRVVIIDDPINVQSAVLALAKGAPEISVVGVAAQNSEAIACIKSANPDVAIIGVLDADIIVKAAAQFPSVRILALGDESTSEDVEKLLHLGAAGYVARKSLSGEIVHAVRILREKGSYIDRSVAANLVDAICAPGAAESLPNLQLSEREQEVVKMIAMGFTNKEIGAQMKLSKKSVDTYRARAAAKLGLKTRAQFVQYAALQGWL